MTTIDLERPADMSRAVRLRQATHGTHNRLDTRIMAAKPFASRERYGQFVMVQHQFHYQFDALFKSPLLDKLLPDLNGRRRLHLIERDLADLGIVLAPVSSKPAFGGHDDIDLPTALGWLYVAEGSNLGAAFLLKQAAKLGLSESFGARHLAAAPRGRGLHWRTFTAALDAVNLTGLEEERVIVGAQAAFARVLGSVEEILLSGLDESALAASQSSAPTDRETGRTS
jgi:heme oxygenase